MLDDTSLDPDFLDESSKTNIEDYICCICQSIPNPHTCLEEENCGHFFCQNCINNWLKKNNSCPFCKQIISKRSIKDKNKVVFRHLINLVVLCQEENCNWKGVWKEYFDHLKNFHNKIINEIKDNFNFELYKYYKATTHEHPLKYLDITMDNGWGCDGRSLPNKCFSGIIGFGQTKGIKRFRCMQCDYDLCELCMKNYYDQKYEIINGNSNNRGLFLFNNVYYTKAHNHPLVFLDKTRDNGWGCDGRKFKEKCFSGITGFNQSKGIPRFRCDKCDFDLCENCFNHYNIKIKYELNNSYKTSIHLHSLTFLDKTRDNGWACDGRKLKEKCFSGITNFNQSKGIPRFRCEKCDFDLCENCMDYYLSHKNGCIIF